MFYLTLDISSSLIIFKIVMFSVFWNTVCYDLRMIAVPYSRAFLKKCTQCKTACQKTHSQYIKFIVITISI